MNHKLLSVNKETNGLSSPLPPSGIVCLMAVTQYVCCAILFMWLLCRSRKRVSIVVVDSLVPILQPLRWRRLGGASQRCPALWFTSAWRRHQMETFSALLAICAGNSPVTGEFPPQRPMTRSFDVSFDPRMNKRLSKQSWGQWFEKPLRSISRHCNSNPLVDCELQGNALPQAISELS